MERELRIVAFTWNVHKSRTLPALDAEADILFVSLQECFSRPDISAITIGYPFIHRASLLGIRTFVLSKTKLDCSSSRLGMGALHFPNKGYVATVVDGSILHINVHLVDQPQRQPERMAQLARILQREGYENYSTVILSGDFNFRIHNGHEQGKDFLQAYGPHFTEQTIDFDATYKFAGAHYNTARTPSYCDRIFVVSKRAATFHKYASMPEVLSSDHKPVYSVFQITKEEDGRTPLDAKLALAIQDHRLTEFYQLSWEKRNTILFFLLGGLCYLIWYFFTNRKK
ncbi:hypothetical protein PAPHI01_0756 [Pancytospora philotis]|nr:hypothetical protein PAPHI01_0756 [Pancytospora philotis]